MRPFLLAAAIIVSALVALPPPQPASADDRSTVAAQTGKARTLATTAPRPRSVQRIAFLGDSLTQGLHASAPERSYRELLVQRMRLDAQRSVITSVVVDPFGMTDDALMRVVGVEVAQPSVVFLEVGNHEAFAGGQEVEFFEQRYDELLYRLQITGALVVAGTLAWLNYPAESREYTDALRLNAIIRRLCAERGIPVADLWTPTVFRPELISRSDDPSFLEPYSGDDFHPNDLGHAALATAFWRAYKRTLARP